MEVEGSELGDGWEEKQFSALSGWQNHKIPVTPTVASGSIGSDRMQTGMLIILSVEKYIY